MSNKQFERQIERIMGQAREGNIRFKDPRRVVGLMTRSVDSRTGKIYEGEVGVRLQNKKLEETRWREENQNPGKDLKGGWRDDKVRT